MSADHIAKLEGEKSSLAAPRGSGAAEPTLARAVEMLRGCATRQRGRAVFNHESCAVLLAVLSSGGSAPVPHSGSGTVGGTTANPFAGYVSLDGGGFGGNLAHRSEGK